MATPIHRWFMRLQQHYLCLEFDTLGLMEIKSVRCLTNSISRFIHLVSCQTSKPIPNQKDFETLAILMKHLKPVLDEIVDDVVPMDEALLKECEELDAAVNEAREFVERWSPKASRILSVLQSEPLLAKIRSSTLETCHVVCKLLRTSSTSPSFAGVQNCIREFQYWQPERILKLIEQGLTSENNKVIPCSHQNLLEIVELLGLVSNQELLKECIAIEREHMKVQADDSKEGWERINQTLEILTLLRDHMLKHGYLDRRYSVPVPSYFHCPLSLDLMSDPVIVASGQTFDRASIQKWLDCGFTICPKSRQHLSHTNLIPNCTIKVLISNWCQANNIKISQTSYSSDAPSVPSASAHVLNQDVIRTDSFRCSVPSSNSSSRSSFDAEYVIGKQKTDEPSVSVVGNSNTSRSPGTEHPSTHASTQLASSTHISSGYVLPETKDTLMFINSQENMMQTSGEIKSDVSSPCLLGRGSQSSKTSAERADNQSSNYPRTISFLSPDSASNQQVTAADAERLVRGLCSRSNDAQTEAAAELRLLTKHNNENRILIAKCGAIRPLISLLYSEAKLTQEHAVTTLLNLSLNDEIKAMIAEAGTIDPLIHVLKTGNDAARENSAAALFSLSLLEEYKVKIGRSGAVKLLVDLLRSGTIRGKKDAATALFNLSICHENKARIVQAGAVKYLVELLDPSSGMVEKAVALLSNLSTIAEGRAAVAREGGIPSIVEIVESGSQRGKENAASVLLQMCLNSNKFCCMVLQEGAVPPLVALSQSGTPRAKEKAQQLLSHFRTQREGSLAKKKLSK
ncbi:hypothetical protein Drorol1_Dr00022233 [Drosera rotundifolia]